GIRDRTVTGVQTCALPICRGPPHHRAGGEEGHDQERAPDPLSRPEPLRVTLSPEAEMEGENRRRDLLHVVGSDEVATAQGGEGRSEERRVGKEGGWRGGRA